MRIEIDEETIAESLEEEGWVCINDNSPRKTVVKQVQELAANNDFLIVDCEGEMDVSDLSDAQRNELAMVCLGSNDHGLQEQLELEDSHLQHLQTIMQQHGYICNKADDHLLIPIRTEPGDLDALRASLGFKELLRQVFAHAEKIHGSKSSALLDLMGEDWDNEFSCELNQKQSAPLSPEVRQQLDELDKMFAEAECVVDLASSEQFMKQVVALFDSAADAHGSKIDATELLLGAAWTEGLRYEVVTGYMERLDLKGLNRHLVKCLELIKERIG